MRGGGTDSVGQHRISRTVVFLGGDRHYADASTHRHRLGVSISKNEGNVT